MTLRNDADRLASPAGSRELRDAAASEDVTLLEVPGGAHDLLHDVASEQVLDAIVTWSAERVELARGQKARVSRPDGTPRT
ncbi:MAG: hypothetical protein R6T93_09275 [Trueperaceae bacterium]